MKDKLLEEKIKALITVLQKQGLWKKTTPQFVQLYKEDNHSTEISFFDWLQFVYLPNLLLHGKQTSSLSNQLIMLQAKEHIKNKGNSNEIIIQLLVEIDAL